MRVPLNVPGGGRSSAQRLGVYVPAERPHIFLGAVAVWIVRPYIYAWSKQFLLGL